MFESTKNDLTKDAIFGERVRTLLFLSMVMNIPISVLLLKEDCTIDRGIVKTGVVETVSNGSGPEWKRCVTYSFILKTDEDCWNEIKHVFAISFSETSDPNAFIKHRNTLNRVQHLRMIYPGMFGRKKFDIETDDGNDSKYYRILSTIKFHEIRGSVK